PRLGRYPRENRGKRLVAVLGSYRPGSEGNLASDLEKKEQAVTTAATPADKAPEVKVAPEVKTPETKAPEPRVSEPKAAEARPDGKPSEPKPAEAPKPTAEAKPAET